MQYNEIVAIGDSFTRGDELADCPPASDIDWVKQQSMLTWPSLFAKQNAVNYKSRSRGGVGNQWISWRVVSGTKPNILVIVNWTFFERFDYIDPSTDYWHHTHPHDEDKLDHYFYRNIDSDIWNIYRNLQIMHSTICFLQQNGINFIMTCIDSQYNVNFATLRTRNNWLRDNRDGTEFLTWEKAITKLQQQVCPYITMFDNMSFLEWSKHKGFELGPNGHPLEKAHIEAAKYINTIITKESQNEH